MATLEESSVSGRHEEELATISRGHDEAFLYVSQGLAYEECGDIPLAREMYNRAVPKLEAALAVRCDRSYCTGPKWAAARQKQSKMRKALSDVRSRLEATAAAEAVGERLNAAPTPEEHPPSYEEACSLWPVDGASGMDVQASDGNRSVPNGYGVADGQNGVAPASVTEAQEMFSIPSGVQIFFISPSGGVSAPSSPTSLYIYRFVDSGRRLTGDRPPAWLQVGDWTYPFIPGQSPAFNSSYGAYLFPDLLSTVPGSAVGVILPADLEQEERELFESYLVKLTVLQTDTAAVSASTPPDKVTTEEEESRLSQKISDGIVAGAELLSKGVVIGAATVSRLVEYGATKVRSKMRPDAPKEMNPQVRGGLKALRELSGATRKVSSCIVNGLGTMTVELGKMVAPHVRSQGEKIIGSVAPRRDSKATMDSVLTVAAGGLQGFSTVYLSLEQAARLLAHSLATETVQVVNHKYGHQAAQVADDAMSSVGNLALAGHNLGNLGVKAIAKRTAKDTGKALLKDYVKQTEVKTPDEDDASTRDKEKDRDGNRL